MKISEARRLQLLSYTSGIMASRPPNLIINGSTRRWMVWPKNIWRNIYIHQWIADDVDQVLHDHEPDNITLLLSGKCDEHFHIKPKRIELHNGQRRFATTSVRRTEGDVVFRLAGTPHKITLPDGPMVTMFLQGPRRRHWGFHCPDGWKKWEGYIDIDRSGKGCG